ncbi:MAG: hypothetical protein ACFFDT_36035, partial [Candidatus Hodarchaeota archaeon]
MMSGVERKWLILLLSIVSVGLFSNVIIIPRGIEQQNSSMLQSSQVYIPPRLSTINVQIVIDSTFNPAINFEEMLAEYAHTYGSNSPLSYKGKYNLTLTYDYLTEIDHQMFVSYLKSIANVNGPNGYMVNTSVTTLEEVDNLFVEQSGVALNATATLYWLANNLWDQTPNRYTLFLFNLTDIDRDYGLEHWFMIHPRDLDTNNTVVEFGDETYKYNEFVHGWQVPAWGGIKAYPLHFIDFSAQNWYGDLLDFWYQTAVWKTTCYSHLQKSLNDWGTPMNVTDTAFLAWLETWINDFIENVFSEPLATYGPGYFKVGKTCSVQILVINNDTANLSNEQLQWTIHDEHMKNEFEKAFNWIDFSVGTRWRNLSEYPALAEG